MKVLLSVLSVCILVFACEPLRPVVSEDTSRVAQSRSYPPGLSSARRLYRDGGDFTRVAKQLRQSILSSDSQQQVEPAQLLQTRLYVEWYQRIRIAAAVLPKVNDTKTLYGGLLAQLEVMPGEDAPSDAVNASVNRNKNGVRSLDNMYAMIDQLRPKVPFKQISAAEIREALYERIGELDQSDSVRSRTFAKAARQFLTLEAKWKYRAEPAEKAAAVRSLAQELLAFADQHRSSGLADNAWLAVAVRSADAMRNPRVPARSSLQVLAELIGHTGKSADLSDHKFLEQMGRGKGSTAVERGMRSWMTVRGRLAQELKKRGRAFTKSDASFFWSALMAHWLWLEPQRVESPHVLYQFAQSDRYASLQAWLQGLRASKTLGPSLLDQLEDILPGRWNRHSRAQLTVAADSLWVMTVVALEMSIDAALGNTGNLRRAQLAPAKVFEQRALMLPNGARMGSYPKRVLRCIVRKKRSSKGCLRRLHRQTVREAKRSPVAPGKGVQRIRPRGASAGRHSVKN